MSLALQSAGSWAFSASTSTMPAVTLGSTTVGDLNLIYVAFKQIGATFTVPAGWTDLTGATASANGAAYGASTGDVKTLVIGRVFVSGDVAPTLATLTGGSTTTASGNVVGILVRAYRATTGFYDIGQAQIADNGGTNWSQLFTGTAAANTGTGIVSTTTTLEAVNDILLSYQGVTSTTPTESAMSFTATGMTTGAVANTPVRSSSATGADLGTNVFTATITAVTTPSNPITANVTMSVTSYGVRTFVRIREGPAPAPTISQGPYRFYADGTESASTAVAAQDTAYAADVTAGDVNTLLRTRLQSTNAGAPAATDDWQLQYETNASGVWVSVSASDTLVDTLDFATANVGIGFSADDFWGQSFLGNGGLLTRASFALDKTGTPPGNLTARLYAHTGTYGAGGTGVDPVLATSTSRLATSTNTTKQWEDFVFDGTYRLVSGTPYVIVVGQDATDISNYVTIYRNASGGAAHSGNQVRRNVGVWDATTTEDVAFRVFAASSVGVFNSANLTDAAATTNRLGAAVGSFVAGKVSEDGLVDDLGWSAQNFTEVLYALTLKQTALTNADALRFRVLRNGVTTGLTYTTTPTINVTKTAPGSGITYVNGTYLTYATHTNSVVIKPTGTVDGDFLIVGLAVGLSAASTMGTAPAGWTAIGTPISSFDGGNFNVKFQLFWKIASGEGASWTWTHASQSSSAIALAYRGVDTATPLDATPVSANGQGTTSTWASITTVTNNAWIVGFGQDWADNAANLTPSAGFTERVEGVLLYAQDSIKTPAGASGTFAHAENSIGTAPWAAWTAALRPASGAAATQPPRNVHLFNPALFASFTR